MRLKIKSLLIIAITALTLGAPAVLVPAVASAAEDNIQKGLCTGANQATGSSSGCTATGDPNEALKGLAAKVVNFLSVVVGIVAVIMIIFGGFKYITSGGDSGNVSGAKNTLVYAIVGLIIVALAQFIVHYVLQTASGSTL